MNRPSLCWRCKKLIGLDPVCPYCGAKMGSPARALPFLSGLFKDMPAQKVLLFFCLGIFILSLVISLFIGGAGGPIQALMQPSSALLQIMGINIYAYEPTRWWTLVTAVFLHIGILHLLFNLYGLHVIGSFLQPIMGSSFLWIMFFVCAVSGSVLTAANGNTAAGASGGIFGWLGAGIIIAFRMGGGFQDPIFRTLMFWGAFSLFFGFSMGTRVDNWGHIGGLISGFFMSSLWLTFRHMPAFRKITFIVAMVLIGVVLLSYFQQVRLIVSSLMA